LTKSLHGIGLRFAKRRKGFIDVLNQFSVFKGTHEIVLSRED
jgi:hypothetical protein